MSDEIYTPHKRNALAEGMAHRAIFLEVYARTLDERAALDAAGVTRWALEKWRRNWADFAAAYAGLRQGLPGQNKITEAAVPYDGTFQGFRVTYLQRTSPWFHIRAAKVKDDASPGSVTLFIWPPEHGKTAFFGDLATQEIAEHPGTRITVGHERKDQADKILDVVRQRLGPGHRAYARLRERFGPFAPLNGQNAFHQTQAWRNDAFNVFKRRLGEEIDFTMQSLGFNSNIAGTRCDWLWIDDPQSRKSLNMTPKYMDFLHDDWFTRPGSLGRTMIGMNVVGDGDVGETLVAEDICETTMILKAYDEDYLELGPRPTKEDPKVLEVSPYLWPERYSPRDYEVMERNAGREGWSRKYQQDWRPKANRTFTDDDIDACRNPLRTKSHRAPTPPGGSDADVWVSLDPAFKRTAVSVDSFEPTIMRHLEHTSRRNLTTTGEMIDMALEQVRDWHHPGEGSAVSHVVVETKGMQKGIITDDAMIEAQAYFGFAIVEQVTGWDKREQELGVAAMARSMARGEIDFCDRDLSDREWMDTLYKEMRRWRPELHGNRLEQDELMVLWFNWTRWHRQRIGTITPARTDQFRYRSLPKRPLTTLARQESNQFRFGAVPSVLRGRR